MLSPRNPLAIKMALTAATILKNVSSCRLRQTVPALLVLTSSIKSRVEPTRPVKRAWKGRKKVKKITSIETRIKLTSLGRPTTTIVANIVIDLSLFTLSVAPIKKVASLGTYTKPILLGRPATAAIINIVVDLNLPISSAAPKVVSPITNCQDPSRLEDSARDAIPVS